ncbi:MAG: 50S ribosomal protein L18 [Spirochaetales bacterium]|nr:50S ribosomal protein L18 [Spirochaetales bacterium]
MNRIKDKINRRNRRKVRIRKKISGTAERPRLSIFKSNKYTYLQAIDDTKGNTLCSISNTEEETRGIKNNQKELAKLGEILGKRLKDKKISTLIFDRNGYKYHGVVKVIADSIRKSGIEF